jgi:hypothetical protein
MSRRKGQSVHNAGGCQVVAKAPKEASPSPGWSLTFLAPPYPTCSPSGLILSPLGRGGPRRVHRSFHFWAWWTGTQTAMLLVSLLWRRDAHRGTVFFFLNLLFFIILYNFITYIPMHQHKFIHSTLFSFVFSLVLSISPFPLPSCLSLSPYQTGSLQEIVGALIQSIQRDC